jgi:hypothetical protein
MSNIANASDQIRTTRQFVLTVLEGIDDNLWFRMPSEGVTHIAWQVGHLAVAHYRLGIVRLREARPEDAAWFPADFIKLFGQGTMPVADPTAYPPVEEIRNVFHAVHEYVLSELPNYTDEQLEEPSLIPHPLYKKKIDSLWWCSRHEAMHAGQIALLKRLMGLPDRW